MNQLATALDRALGSSVPGNTLTLGQMVLRAVFVFLVWLVIVRLADKRLLGKYSAFDVVLAVMLGAVLGRTINGSAPLWETLAATAVLVALHWTISFLAFRWHAFGHLVKGSPIPLIANGEINAREMRKNFITSHDLEEMLRLNGRIDEPSQTRLAMLERNGQISVLPRGGNPRVVDIQVRGGVQTVRLEL